MIHYLKKQWRLSTLTCLFAIIAYGAQALIPAGEAIFFLLLYRSIVRPKQFAL